MSQHLMNIMKTIRLFKLSLAISCALFVLIACSGDSRPFEESVETNQLNLSAISITPPVNAITPLFVNPGEEIKFSVQATNQAGLQFALSGERRRWSVSPSSVASIDSNGNLTARANGEVLVGLQIGGLEAVSSLTVSDAVLTSINPITEINLVADATPNSLERCIPESFTASGAFSDGTTRQLPEITWQVANADFGFVRTLADGTAEVVGTNAGVLELIATSGNVVSNPPTAITVEDNLLRIDTTPPGQFTVGIGESDSLFAFGVYPAVAQTAEGNMERSVNITNNVQWSVTPADGLASVLNGVVTGEAIGSGTVTAACGTTFDETVITVTEDTTADDLAFEFGSTRSVSLSQGTIQLRVSTGSEYDSDDDVTFDDDTTWLVISQVPEVSQVAQIPLVPQIGSNVAAFSLPTNGLISLLGEGTATIRVEVDDEEAQMTLIVGP